MREIRAAAPKTPDSSTRRLGSSKFRAARRLAAAALAAAAWQRASPPIACPADVAFGPSPTRRRSSTAFSGRPWPEPTRCRRPGHQGEAAVAGLEEGQGDPCERRSAGGDGDPAGARAEPPAPGRHRRVSRRPRREEAGESRRMKTSSFEPVPSPSACLRDWQLHRFSGIRRNPRTGFREA
jgi:hypothetical protein